MKFKTNEGKIDRIIRFVSGSLLIIFGFGFLTGILQILSFIIGAILLFTSLTGFCGLYALLGINTCEVKVRSKKSRK